MSPPKWWMSKMADPNANFWSAIPGLDGTSRLNSALPSTAGIPALRFHVTEYRTRPYATERCLPAQTRWQVSIGPPGLTATQRMIDRLPDLVMTTAQCIRQKFDPNFDLAAIPPRRRREFTQHRFKYTRRAASPEIMAEFNGYKTLFGLLDRDARYRFTYRFDALDSLARDIAASALRFEFLEMYAFDLYQHWNLDNGAGMREALGRTDRFVANLRERCVRNGLTLVLLSDHGQEPVTDTIPLVRTLRKSGVPKTEYSYYCGWLTPGCSFTERAREAIVSKPATANCSLLYFSDHQYQVCFDDARFGVLPHGRRR
jgi:hypothetical protein